MKQILCLALFLVGTSAFAARGPVNNPNPQQPPQAPHTPWPPSSPQTNNCGGQPCFPSGGGGGPQNGRPFAVMPRCGWGAGETDGQGRPLCFDQNLNIGLCEDITCEI